MLIQQSGKNWFLGFGHKSKLFQREKESRGIGGLGKSGKKSLGSITQQVEFEMSDFGTFGYPFYTEIW